MKCLSTFRLSKNLDPLKKSTQPWWQKLVHHLAQAMFYHLSTRSGFIVFMVVLSEVRMDIFGQLLKLKHFTELQL